MYEGNEIKLEIRRESSYDSWDEAYKNLRRYNLWFQKYWYPKFVFSVFVVIVVLILQIYLYCAAIPDQIIQVRVLQYESLDSLPY